VSCAVPWPVVARALAACTLHNEHLDAAVHVCGYPRRRRIGAAL